jgi:hypothetical protein
MASATNSQNVLPILVEPSLSTLSTIFSSYTSSEEITSSRQRKKFSPILKIPKKFSIEKIAPLFCFFFLVTEEEDKTEQKRKKHRKNKVKEQRNRKCKQSQYFRSTRSGKAEK